MVLRPDDIDLTEIFHKLITSFVSKAESEKQLTSDILRIILDTIDTVGHESGEDFTYIQTILIRT